jgi:hypothetical protein
MKGFGPWSDSQHVIDFVSGARRSTARRRRVALYGRWTSD